MKTLTLRQALQAIIDAANANPEPIHYKIRDAINEARESLREADRYSKYGPKIPIPAKKMPR